MIKRQFLGLVASVFVGVLLLSGCTIGAKKEAADFVKNYYQGWIDGKMTAESSYDDHISQKSKDLLGMSKEEYVRTLNDTMQDLNVKYTEVSIVGEEKTGNDIYRIRRTLKTVSDAGENKKTGYDYVIKENGRMKFLEYGAYEKTDYTRPIEKPSMLNISMPTVYLGNDNLVLFLEVKNNSATNYSIGYMGNGQIVVTTDKGEYTQDMSLPPQTLMMSTGARSGLVVVDGAKGKIKKVVINNVYTLGDKLKPSNVHNSFSLTVYDETNQ